MKYEWDEDKRVANLAKHGVDFIGAQEFNWERALVIPDTRRHYGEPRFRAQGPIHGRLHELVFTPRGNVVRIISLRKANPREVHEYEKTQT